MTKLEKIDLALSKGKVQGAKQLLKEYYQAEDKAAWDKAKHEEYEALYPSMRDMTDDEKAKYDEANFSEDNPKSNEFEYPQVEIKYITIDEDGNEVRTPEDYLTYTEWLNETKVVKEAVYDDDGILIEPEETEPIRPYVAIEITEDRINSYESLTTYLKEKAKIEKQKTLDTLSVTANTVAYDANGKAISNMGAVVSLANYKFNKALADDTSAKDAYQSIYKDTTIGWKGYDNLVHQVEVESICEALELGMKEVAKVVGV